MTDLPRLLREVYAAAAEAVPTTGTSWTPSWLTRFTQSFWFGRVSAIPAPHWGPTDPAYEDTRFS
jgi:hypothetical protein